MTEQTTDLGDACAQVWAVLGSAAVPAAALRVSGPSTVLPSAFDVTGLATGAVAAATLAAAEYHAARGSGPAGSGPAGSGPAAVVRVDSRAACAAFAAEALFQPDGWSLPDIWDPVAGNYRARDRWIRLHTNYAYHRAAVAQVLRADDRAAVTAAVSRWAAADLEAAVVAAGGCAAVMYDRETWLASAPGTAAAAAPVLEVTERPLRGKATAAAERPAGQPYAGVRVLDLTRVIAGPVCTRFLATFGADVLRVDPPGFAEVPALLPETTAGKRTASVDLHRAAGRADFERLVADADVLVCGLRADALSRLGYDDDALTALNPGLIIATLNAYGWQGPWRDRRGFDSLVQMSCGIAAAGETANGEAAAGQAAAGAGRPVPLPVQALDHATGYLLAAAVGRALTGRLTRQAVTRIRASLTGTANLLWSLPRPARGDQPPPGEDMPLTATETAWGPGRRVPPAGQIDGVVPVLPVEAGPLGRHQPAW